MTKKIALVGIGKIALDQHVPSINESPDWELAATYSRKTTVPGVPSFDDFDRMLEERGDIEMVSLCVPPQARFELAAKSLRAGRHVMLEKPPGATLSECLTLRDLALAADRSIYATWHSRQADQVAVAKKWLASRTLTKMRVEWREDARQWHPGQTWIWEPGGMGVFDPGINALSIVTEILPTPIHLKSADLVFPSNCQAPSEAYLTFNHSGGAEVTADMEFLAPGAPTWSIYLETTEGSAVLSEGGAKLSINGAPQPEPEDAGLFAGRDGAAPIGREYPRLYKQMAELVARGEIDMDLAPMAHVVDAFALGSRRETEPFHDPALA